MTKSAACTLRIKSRQLICAVAVGTFTAVALFGALQSATVPELSWVPTSLIWLLIFCGTYRYRSRLRLLPSWFVCALILSEIGFIGASSLPKNADRGAATLTYASLEAAIRTGNGAAVEAILNRGADPNYAPTIIARTGSGNRSRTVNCEPPVETAIDGRNFAIADLLVAHGASVFSHGADELDFAALKGDLPTVRFLLRHGIDANTPDGNSNALWNAVSANQSEIVAELLEAGANPNSYRIARGSDGSESVLEVAQSMNCRPIILLLRRAGATV